MTALSRNATASSSILDTLKPLTGTFFANGSIDARLLHPEFDKLFSFGIDPVDGGLPSDQPSDWPSFAVGARLWRVRRNT